MTNEQLFELLCFEEGLESVEIVSQQRVGKDMGVNAVFVRAKLIFPEGMEVALSEPRIVPFVWYEGTNWIFTPWDWQGELPVTAEDIDRINWRVNDTSNEGLIFNGLPMLSPLAPEPKAPVSERVSVGRQVREARERAGLSIRELAESSGLGHGHIVRIEAGRYNVTVDTLEKLGNALGFRIVLEEEE